MRKLLVYLAALLIAAAPALAQQTGGGGGSGLPAGGTSSNMLIGTPAWTTVFPNGMTATTQAAGDASADVATNAFVAAAIQFANPASSVQEATAAVLPNSPTYANGTAGVGATLTAGANAALVVDGVTASSGDRVLVDSQASAFQNGVYTVTTVGSGGAPWVLTRATDYNTPQNINWTGIVSVIGGNTLSGTNWLLTSYISAVGSGNSINYTQQTSGGSGGGGNSSGVKCQPPLTKNNVLLGAGGNSCIASASIPSAITGTTQAPSDNSTKLATTAYTTTGIANAIAAVNPAVAVAAATTQASDTSGLTYSNGVSGIGATFTGATNTALTFDGQTLTSVGQRVLIKNDTQSPSGAFNGVYYLTQLQTSLLPPILTRALDYDQPSDINSTGAIPVQSGTTNALTSWLLTSTVNTVGTDALTYSKFAFNPSAGPCPQSATTAAAFGCLGAPVNTQTSSYQLVAGDAGGMVNMNVTGAGTLTIPANASVAFPVGTLIGVMNTGAAQDTVAITSDTLQTGIGGALVTGSISLPVGAQMSLLKTASTTWFAQIGTSPAVIKIVTSGSATSETISVPPGYSTVQVHFVGRSLSASSDALCLQLNADTGSNYQQTVPNYINGTWTAGAGISQSYMNLGELPPTGALTNAAAQITGEIDHYGNTTYFKNYVGQSFDQRGSTAATLAYWLIGNMWQNQAAVSQMKFFTASGSGFANGDILEVEFRP